MWYRTCNCMEANHYKKEENHNENDEDLACPHLISLEILAEYRKQSNNFITNSRLIRFLLNRFTNCIIFLFPIYVEYFCQWYCRQEGHLSNQSLNQLSWAFSSWFLPSISQNLTTFMTDFSEVSWAPAHYKLHWSLLLISDRTGFYAMFFQLKEWEV